MPKPEKVEAVAEMKELFEQAESFFVTDYQGLNVADITVLRTQSAQEECPLHGRQKHAAQTERPTKPARPGLEKYFKGPTAVAFALNDPPVAAKILNDSFKEKQLPRIKAFVVRRADPWSGRHRSAGRSAVARSAPVDVVGSCRGSAPAAVSARVDGFFSRAGRTVDALAEKRKGAASEE